MLALNSLLTVKPWMIVAGMLVAVVSVSSCTSSGGNVSRSLDTGQAQVAGRALSPNPVGEVIGNGNVRVSLLVPLSIPGGGAAVAKELRNGAELAMQDFGRDRLQLVVKDTKGQAAESQAKASEAIAEGSSLILGPLFAANVSAASGVTQPANISMLAFSTDTSVARRGAYLFSYTPQSDTQRMIDYAASLGRKSIVAFLPRNAEGSLRKQVLTSITSRNRIGLTVHEYNRTPEGIEAVLVEGAVSAQNADSVYIPEGGPIPGLIIGGLSRNGVDLAGKQLLGSGAWEAVETQNSNLDGAIFPGRDTSRFNSFAGRYQRKYGVQPGVQAALAYDAVTLASELVRVNSQGNAFTSGNFEIDRGFQGVSGAFRIRSNGTTERGLAIYQISSGSKKIIEPAISSFSGRGS